MFYPVIIGIMSSDILCDVLRSSVTDFGGLLACELNLWIRFFEYLLVAHDF